MDMIATALLHYFMVPCKYDFYNCIIFLSFRIVQISHWRKKHFWRNWIPILKRIVTSRWLLALSFTPSYTNSVLNLQVSGIVLKHVYSKVKQ
jgi:hypothetical protein